MKEQAANILLAMAEFGVGTSDPVIWEKMVEKVEQVLKETEVLQEAVKREVLFQAKEAEIELTEEDADVIAKRMVHQRDWSHFNDWISDEIKEYLKEQ